MRKSRLKNQSLIYSEFTVSIRRRYFAYRKTKGFHCWSLHHPKNCLENISLIFISPSTQQPRIYSEVEKTMGGRQDGRPDPARKLYDIYYCCMYSEKLLMMDRGTVRNM